jgi:hypothetical protein
MLRRRKLADDVGQGGWTTGISDDVHLAVQGESVSFISSPDGSSGGIVLPVWLDQVESSESGFRLWCAAFLQNY